MTESGIEIRPSNLLRIMDWSGSWIDQVGCNLWKMSVQVPSVKYEGRVQLCVLRMLPLQKEGEHPKGYFPLQQGDCVLQIWSKDDSITFMFTLEHCNQVILAPGSLILPDGYLDSSSDHLPGFHIFVLVYFVYHDNLQLNLAEPNENDGICDMTDGNGISKSTIVFYRQLFRSYNRFSCFYCFFYCSIEFWIICLDTETLSWWIFSILSKHCN